MARTDNHDAKEVWRQAWVIRHQLFWPFSCLLAEKSLQKLNCWTPQSLQSQSIQKGSS